jgi:polyisoprenoid-binding protein YceI
MKIRAGLFLVLVAVFSSSAGGAKADAPVPTRFLGECDIAFLVTSTLHDVSGSARCRPFSVRIAREPSGKEVIPIVEVEVPVAVMDTRNKSRDRQMREMFLSDRFPRIRGEALDVDVERIRVEIGKGRGGNVSIDLLLRIRDVERKVRATASNLRESGERVTFDLEFPVSLREFGLKAPSVLGIIRVGDTVSVKVTFALTVSRSP